MNRASTVWASTRRALNRNALSGGSGFTCANEGRPAASAAATTKPLNAPRRRSSAALMCGLRGDPVEISGQATADRDSHNLGKFVWVTPADRLLDTQIERRSRFNGERNLPSRFDLTAPVIQ